jgi:hypothetical protein
LSNRVNFIQQSQELADKYAYQYRLVVENETRFHQQSLQLALSFERYIQIMTESQGQQRQNANILLALKQAEQ